eukprot:1155956-Pelagomonas_calceolata.AAC.9
MATRHILARGKSMQSIEETMQIHPLHPWQQNKAEEGACVHAGLPLGSGHRCRHIGAAFGPCRACMSKCTHQSMAATSWITHKQPSCPSLKHLQSMHCAGQQNHGTACPVRVTMHSACGHTAMQLEYPPLLMSLSSPSSSA